MVVVAGSVCVIASNEIAVPAARDSVVRPDSGGVAGLTGYRVSVERQPDRCGHRRCRFHC